MTDTTTPTATAHTVTRAHVLIGCAASTDDLTDAIRAAAPVAPPPGCEEVDGVAWCVVHDGVVDELSDRLDDDGEPRCDMCDELDDACRIVPLFLRVEEADHG